MSVLLAVAAAGSAAGASPVAAQQPSDAELVARVQALVPEYEAAAAARAAQRQANRENERSSGAPTPVDTVTVGPLRIVTLPEEVETARELFGDVWRTRFPGVRESPSLAAHLFVFQWRARLWRFVVEPAPGTQLINVEISRVWAPSRGNAEAFVANEIARALVTEFPSDSPLGEWLTARSDPDDETAYRELATDPSGASRDCLAGDVAACMASLGLGFAGSPERLPRWFTAEERQEMVESAAVAGRIDTDAIPYRGCVEENDADACDPMLADLDWVTSLPTSDRLRAHLLWFAARTGGESGWRRLLARRDAPMPEALAELAGRPVEELVAEWRADVVAHRPDVQAGLGGRGTRALLWSLIFMAFAMRSTRWRLG